MYKGEFLKNKLNDQIEKRKRDRKNKKSMTMPKKADKTELKKPLIRREGQEDLEELIDDLKNDVTMKEMELESLRAAFTKMEMENKKLRKLYDKERADREVIEAKLKKTTILNELKENHMAI